MAGTYDHVTRHRVKFSCHRRTLFCVGKLINVFVSILCQGWHSLLERRISVLLLKNKKEFVSCLGFPVGTYLKMYLGFWFYSGRMGPTDKEMIAFNGVPKRKRVALLNRAA